MSKGWDWLMLLGWGVLIFIMVRPGSQGPGLISAALGGAGTLVSDVEGAKAGGAGGNTGGTSTTRRR